MLALVFAGACLGATINVSPGQSIQNAINSSVNGDTIDIAAGTYYESGSTLADDLF